MLVLGSQSKFLDVDISVRGGPGGGGGGGGHLGI